jgi:type II secretory pathway component PulM
MGNIQQATVKTLILNWADLPNDVKKSVMKFRSFHDGATIVLSGSDFDPVANNQTYDECLSIDKLKALYKQQMEVDEVKYTFGDYVKDFNLHIYVWLAKNRKKLDLKVQQIQINVGFGGFDTLLK